MSNTMRFFRGIAVPASAASSVISSILADGLLQGAQWKMEYQHPGAIDALFSKSDLNTEDTRPKGTGFPAVCACGDEASAAYYAWQHNRSETNDTPIIIEFEVMEDSVAIDGRDFLYTVFQMGDPSRAQHVIEEAFGTSCMRYANKAWASDEMQTRIALCDLARYDPQVVRAHHNSALTLNGRWGTVFKSAFITKLPIHAAAIIRAWIPTTRPVFVADVSLPELLIAQKHNKN